ncbi:MAG: helix-turn-helix domain-containing protein [Bacteroidetes bacterium]|nr:helix-turn-helix domain-containing protein [Bacteroidota bacterium]
MYFSSNIKFLRKRQGRTQDDVAFALRMKRSTLSGYENNVAQPGLEALAAFSGYFGIAIDTLIKIDLGKLPESQVRQLEKGFDVFIKGSQLRVLTTTVSDDNEDNIELVNEKAKAGYASGFADPEYISILPTFRLPFLSKNKKYRTFQISGDSMHPIPHGAFVTGVFVQDWNIIKDKDACIILTIHDGIVFKIVENRIDSEGTLMLHSLNPLYPPFTLEVNEIREVWQFVHYISPEMPENQVSEQKTMMTSIRKMEDDIRAIQLKLKL